MNTAIETKALETSAPIPVAFAPEQNTIAIQPSRDPLMEAQAALDRALESITAAWHTLREVAKSNRLSDGYTTLTLELTGQANAPAPTLKTSVYFDQGANIYSQTSIAALIGAIRNMDPTRKAQILALKSQLNALEAAR